MAQRLLQQEAHQRTLEGLEAQLTQGLEDTRDAEVVVLGSGGGGGGGGGGEGEEGGGGGGGGGGRGGGGEGRKGRTKRTAV